MNDFTEYLGDLKTDDKSNLIAAINEVLESAAETVALVEWAKEKIEQLEFRVNELEQNEEPETPEVPEP